MYDRNFGFIQVEGEEDDIFFHRSGTKGEFQDLKEDSEVEFEIEETDRGKQATNVEAV
ncbi:MAG: cold shock domain-containing protein [Candidatus Heimdallarchaeota archaeon]|nr:cold shock domain-containing protein [Candidatus Heimdallarchaeota archaeon]